MHLAPRDAGATLAFTEGDGASVIDATLTLTDVDDTNLRKCHGADHSWPSIWQRMSLDLRISLESHPGSYNSTEWNVDSERNSNKGSV